MLVVSFFIQIQILLTNKDMKEILLKIKLSSFFAIIAAFLLPIKFIMLTVGFAIMADTLVGLYRAKKKGEKITSRKLSQVISKMVLYQSSVVLFFCIEQFILADFIILFTGIPLFLTKLVGALLVFIEIQSINESLESLTGKGIWDRLKELIRRAKDIKEDISDFKSDSKPEEEANGKTDL
jgi:hypothetical protein